MKNGCGCELNLACGSRWDYRSMYGVVGYILSTGHASGEDSI